jgi:predicted RNA-binding Zn-ribbon protein involved in translation (DUF1610 family)
MRTRRAGFHASLPRPRLPIGAATHPAAPIVFLRHVTAMRVFVPINKCQHGVYVPEGESRAPYCQVCTPGGPTDTKDVVLPRSSSDPLSSAGRVMANKRQSNGCPECGSVIYLRKNERSDVNRECADCGASYRVRLSDQQRAQLIKAEAEE